MPSIRYTFPVFMLCLFAVAYRMQAQCDASVAVFDVTCFGLNNGSIQLNPDGGTAPYTYNWSNGQTDQNISDLAPGHYDCTITDALACTVTVSGDVFQPSAPLSISTTGGTINCYAPTLTIQTTVTGGTPPYTYQWSNGATTSNPQVIIGGTYFVTATDAHGCEVYAQTNVDEDFVPTNCLLSPPPSLTCITPTVTINANCSGSLILYQWTTDVGNIVNGAQTSTVLVNATGTYTLTATDASNGCTTQSSVVVTQDYNTPTANAGPDQVLTCNITSLQLNGSGSSTGPQYAYYWTGPAIFSGASTLFPTVGGEGPYTLIVTNAANGCTASDEVLVTFLDVIPTADAGPIQGLPCGGGQVTLMGSGPVGAQYTMFWTGPGITPANQFLLNPVVNLPGTYTLTISNALNGCTAISQTTVFAGPIIPNQQLAITPVSCFGTSTGAIDLTFNLGTPPYIYHWSNGANTEDIQFLPAGAYVVTVTDATLCSYYTEVILTQPGSINTNIQKTNATCNGAANGSINLSVGGGAQPYFYLWSNGQTTQDLSNIVAGTYTCTITDSNGCTKTSSATITQPAGISLSVTTVNIPCNGELSGIIDLHISGGQQPYSYDWSNDGPEPVDNDPQDWLHIPAGTYTVTVTTASGCTNTISTTLTEPTALVTSLTSIEPNCLSSDGSVDLSVSGGVAPYSYHWNTNAITQDLSNVPAGTYSVTVVDANICTRTLSASLSNIGISSSATITPIQCFGQTNGSIDLSVTGAAGPLSYSWTGPNGYTSSLEDPANLTAGTYAVSITAPSGCVALGGPFVVTQPQSPITLQATGSIYCFGGSDGEASVLATGGAAPYAYLWSNGATTATQSGIPAGIYTVTVTDNNACSMVSSPINLAMPAAINISFSTLSSNCESTVVAAVVHGGSGAYQFDWSDGSQDSLAQFFSTGDYTLSVTDAHGCTAVSSYSAQIASGDCSLLKGRVYQDTMQNCQFDNGEPALSGWIVRAIGTGGTFYGLSDANGDYSIDVLAGNYNLFIAPPNPLWNPCWQGLSVGAVQVSDTLGGFDFPVKKYIACPFLSVDISSSNLRRCFLNNYYTVKYCNHGTEKAFDAYVLLDLDDFLIPLGSTIPYTNQGNGVLRFEVGDLEVGECRSFNLTCKVSCDAVLGQTHCTEALVFPNNSCIVPSVLWSGASVHLSSECLADSVRFHIENVGLGDMTDALSYSIIEDGSIWKTGFAKLNSGESITVSTPANGSTWRIEMEQEPFHPGQSAPSVTVEGCSTGTTFSTGFVTQFPADDADEFVDIDCKANVASSDPNDKQAFPLGYGTQHYIRPGTPLEYQIQFQNTGNDTAFTVRIVDTLSSWLDPTTIRPGAGSHPYSWDLNGLGVLSFQFDNILLPDSNVNEAASHGFVTFTIHPRADAPLETVIENTAEIYFDYNEAVVTNTTFHRLGEHFVSVGLWQPVQPKYEVLVSPNPFSDAAVVELKGLQHSSVLRLQVFDLQGKMRFEMQSKAEKFQIKRGLLQSGAYLFKIDEGGILLGTGKFIIQDQ